MRRGDLLQQVSALAADLPAALPSAPVVAQVRALCATARLVFGAAAVSVAVVQEEGLRYVAADGAGADEIVGTVLPLGRGIAGYVALSGQALAVDASADARFARDVAERTGYVPTTLLVVPVRDLRGEVIGVVSVLDREAHAVEGSDALQLGTSFAAEVALVLPLADEVGRVARLVLGALGDAVASGDAELAPALRRAIARLPEADADLVRIAATLNELRAVDPTSRARVADLLEQVVALATAGRRR